MKNLLEAMVITKVLPHADDHLFDLSMIGYAVVFFLHDSTQNRQGTGIG